MDDQGVASGGGRLPHGNVLTEEFMRQTQLAVCVSDPHQPDMPIVFANDAFLRLTGYDRDEVVGRNCRFLQGDETDPQEVDWVRRSLRDRDVCAVELLNYRKDGTAFWNALHIGPVFDEDGSLLYYFGSQWDVTEKVEARESAGRARVIARELQARLRSVFGVLASIVSLSARGESSVPRMADAMRGRITALARAHEATLQPEGKQRTADLHRLIDALIEPHGEEVAGRVGTRGAMLAVPPTLVAPIGLALHELMLQSTREGALRRGSGGSVEITWSTTNNTLVLGWNESAAFDALPESVSGIIRSVLNSVDGRIEHSSDDRSRAIITIPMPTLH